MLQVALHGWRHSFQTFLSQPVAGLFAFLAESQNESFNLMKSIFLGPALDV